MRKPAESVPAPVPTGIVPKRARATPPAVARANVLVVEDNKSSAESMMLLVELFGHTVRVVDDGRAALEAIAADRPDVMLVDIGLPRMDGYELARLIRRTKDGQRLKLVALTGYGRAEDKQRALEAGFDLHVVKPVDVGMLKDLLASVARKTGTQ